MENEIYIYTDGSSLGNPGQGGWGAIILGEKWVKEIGERKKETTNNEMELEAVRNALLEVNKSGGKSIKLFADSKYVLRGINEWSRAWEKNGWTTKAKQEVAHSEIWKEVLRLKKEIENSREIVFLHVPGHAKHPGNERADAIARGFAEGKQVALYDGSSESYPLDLKTFEIDETKLEKRKRNRERSRTKAYSYLSLVDGVLKRHETWADCEARVKGKRSAKFKKAISKKDEEGILSDWGFSSS